MLYFHDVISPEHDLLYMFHKFHQEVVYPLLFVSSVYIFIIHYTVKASKEPLTE